MYVIFGKCYVLFISFYIVKMGYIIGQVYC